MTPAQQAIAQLVEQKMMLCAELFKNDEQFRKWEKRSDLFVWAPFGIGIASILTGFYSQYIISLQIFTMLIWSLCYYLMNRYWSKIEKDLRKIKELELAIKLHIATLPKDLQHEVRRNGTAEIIHHRI